MQVHKIIRAYTSSPDLVNIDYFGPDLRKYQLL